MDASRKDIKRKDRGDVDGSTQRSHEFGALNYDMNHQKRGTFIIINNETFDRNLRLPDRTGSSVDEANLKYVFGDLLGFQVLAKKNLGRTEMLQLMIAESKKDHSDCDCFGVAVLTHGEDGKLYGQDEIIEIESLVAPIKDCESLAGKPKLFFFQACRGYKFDDGVMVTVESDAPGELFHASNQKQIRLPVEADFLYAYSTVPGYYSWRNNVDGSWFVQALTKNLKKHAFKDIDLVRILTRVNHQVAYEFESKSMEPGFAQKKEVPSIVSMLTKDLYFAKK